MLRPGARIAVVAPSGIYDPERVRAATKLLESWGFDVTRMAGLNARHRYLAGDDATRREDLVRALCGDYDAVWMARGGYGLARLLPTLPWTALRRIPFFGFSDASALLNPLLDRGLVPVHAPVLNALVAHNDEMTRAHLHALVVEGRCAPIRGVPIVPGTVEAPLCGGNLCVLASMCGTPWQLRGRGRIVLLEDVNEPPYKLDRLLTQLLQSGALDGAAAFVLGDFTGAELPEGTSWTAEDVIVELLRPFGVPILARVGIGHAARNLAIPFGPARLDGDQLVSLA